MAIGQRHHNSGYRTEIEIGPPQQSRATRNYRVDIVTGDVRCGSGYIQGHPDIIAEARRAAARWLSEHENPAWAREYDSG